MSAQSLGVDDLRVSYGGQVAVHGLSLTVGAGECVTILGANGAGKTSVLGAISGLVRPVTGAIRLDGKRIERLSGSALSRLGILHIPEGRGVFPSLTVSDNLRVMLGADREARERVLDQLPRLGERLNQAAGTMSGGEQQMLALAPALAGGYRFLLVDELSLGLAPLIVDMLFEQLAMIRATGVGMVVVEQFAQRALDLATHAYVMRKGRVVFEGPSEDLLSRPDHLRALYFGTPT